MMQRVYKTLLEPTPEAARAKLDELALKSGPDEFAIGQRLRTVAAELVRRDLEVTAVDYRDGSQELEVIMPQARHIGPVTVDRDGSGNGCQLAWEQWVDISGDVGIERAADMVSAMLRAIADAVQGSA